MVCAPVRSIIPSLKLEDYLSVQVCKACSITHIIEFRIRRDNTKKLGIIFNTNMYFSIKVPVVAPH